MLTSKFKSPCSTSLLAPLQVALPSPIPNALPSLQSAFTRRTSGHCLGTFIVVNLSLFLLIKCSVSHYAPPPPCRFLFSLICLFIRSFGFKGLKHLVWRAFIIFSPDMFLPNIGIISATFMFMVSCWGLHAIVQSVLASVPWLSPRKVTKCRWFWDQ
jgi:hypothetical protein